MSGVETSIFNPFSYDLEILTIVNNEGESFDVKDTFQQFLITEDITQPFLTGELILVDSTGILERAKLTGQESVRIRFKHPEANHENDTIDQLFRIYRVMDILRENQNIQTIKCLFASPEFIEAKRKRISQAFNGNLLDIVAKLSTDHLGITHDENLDAENPPPKMTPYFERRAKSEQFAHLVVPNWTVFDTITWLCAQAQDSNHDSHLTDSYFFNQTANGGYRLHSLKQMYGIDYLGGDEFAYSVVYGDAKTREASPDEEAKELEHPPGRRIISYINPSSANVLDGITNGLFGSKLTTIDSTFKHYREKTYNLLERFYAGDNTIDDHPFIRIAEEHLNIGESSTDPSQDLVCRGLYGNETLTKPLSSYPDATQLLMTQNSYVNDPGNKIPSVYGRAHLGGAQTQMAVHELLSYHTIQCLISARSDISTGQLINLKLTLPAPEGLMEDWEPIFYNGKHLIRKIQWSATKTRMELNITCMKDSVENHIEMTEIPYPEKEFVGPPKPEE